MLAIISYHTPELHGKLIVAIIASFLVSALNLPECRKNLGLAKNVEKSHWQENWGNRNEKISWSALLHV